MSLGRFLHVVLGGESLNLAIPPRAPPRAAPRPIGDRTEALIAMRVGRLVFSGVRRGRSAWLASYDPLWFRDHRFSHLDQIPWRDQYDSRPSRTSMVRSVRP